MPNRSRFDSKASEDVPDLRLKGEETFLDSMYSGFIERGSDDGKGLELLEVLRDIILNEDYDTEAMDMDLNMLVDDGTSNISQEIQNDRFMGELVKTFEEKASC